MGMRRRGIVWLIAIGAMLCACTTLPPHPTPELEDRVGGSEQDAVALLTAWLAAAGGGADDRGYSLLYPVYREDIFGSEESYVAAMSSVLPEDLGWEVVGVSLRDGEYHVAVRIPNGPDQVPEILLGWRLPAFPAGGDDPLDIGDVVVRISPAGGPAGIQGG